MTGIEIELLNWDKYNPRKDFKKPWWFALSNTLVEDSDFYDFSHGEFKAWIYVLSQASKKKSARIMINLVHAERTSCISFDDFRSALKKLETLRMITVICTDSVRETNATLHNSTVQNRIHVLSDESTQVKVEPKFDLESLYKQYPKRQGNQRKAVGLKSLAKIIKQQTDFDDAMRAVKNYKHHAVTSKTEGTPMVAMFATFFGRDEIWKEWVDRSSESTTQPLAAVDFKRLAFGGG